VKQNARISAMVQDIDLCQQASIHKDLLGIKKTWHSYVRGNTEVFMVKLKTIIEIN